MPGQSQNYHFDNCMELFTLLLTDLFDALSHFTRFTEVTDVLLQLSTRVYEAGGHFDRYLTHQNEGTTQLNNLLALNRAFSYALSQAPSSSGQGSSSGAGAPGASHGGANLDHDLDGKTATKWLNGNSLRFGKGASGPTYNIGLIMPKLREVQSNINRSNFCVVHYLSTTGNACQEVKHHAGCAQHKFSQAIQALRPSFEHKPYRTDSKAKDAG